MTPKQSQAWQRILDREWDHITQVTERAYRLSASTPEQERALRSMWENMERAGHALRDASSALYGVDA